MGEVAIKAQVRTRGVVGGRGEGGGVTAPLSTDRGWHVRGWGGAIKAAGVRPLVPPGVRTCSPLREGILRAWLGGFGAHPLGRGGRVGGRGGGGRGGGGTHCWTMARTGVRRSSATLPAAQGHWLQAAVFRSGLLCAFRGGGGGGWLVRAALLSGGKKKKESLRIVSRDARWPTSGQGGYITPDAWGVPTASEAGAISEVAHKWAR